MTLKSSLHEVVFVGRTVQVDASKRSCDWVKRDSQSATLLYAARKTAKMADELPDDFDVIVLGTGMFCVYKYCNVIKFDVTRTFINFCN